VGAGTGVLDAGGKRKAWVHGGDLFVKDLASGGRRQLTRAAAAESSPRWLLDGRLSFRRGGRFLARDLRSGLAEELVELRFEDEPGPKTDQSDLARRNRRLLEHVRDVQDTRDARRTRRSERRVADPDQESGALVPGEGRRVQGGGTLPRRLASPAPRRPGQAREGAARPDARLDQRGRRRRREARPREGRPERTLRRTPPSPRPGARRADRGGALRAPRSPRRPLAEASRGPASGRRRGPAAHRLTARSLPLQRPHGPAARDRVEQSGRRPHARAALRARWRASARRLSRGRLHPRCRLPAERPPGLVQVRAGVPVPPAARRTRLRVSSTWTGAAPPATAGIGGRRSTGT
jgi:hypothetical protein